MIERPEIKSRLILHPLPTPQRSHQRWRYLLFYHPTFFRPTTLYLREKSRDLPLHIVCVADYTSIDFTDGGQPIICSFIKLLSRTFNTGYPVHLYCTLVCLPLSEKTITEHIHIKIIRRPPHVLWLEYSCRSQPFQSVTPKIIIIELGHPISWKALEIVGVEALHFTWLVSTDKYCENS